jgi:hypothetical protein
MIVRVVMIVGVSRVIRVVANPQKRTVAEDVSKSKSAI